jgi:anti-anti-sigma regulatory factor
VSPLSLDTTRAGATIIVAAIDAERDGGRFALVAGSEPVMRVFEVTRMRERLRFVDAPEALG